MKITMELKPSIRFQVVSVTAELDTDDPNFQQDVENLHIISQDNLSQLVTKALEEEAKLPPASRKPALSRQFQARRTPPPKTPYVSPYGQVTTPTPVNNQQFVTAKTGPNVGKPITTTDGHPITMEKHQLVLSLQKNKGANFIYYTRMTMAEVDAHIAHWSNVQ